MIRHRWGQTRRAGKVCAKPQPVSHCSRTQTPPLDIRGSVRECLRFVDAYGGAEPWAALGDPTRHAIVVALAERPRAVSELAAKLPVSRPAVSQALRILKDAGLVSERAEGTRHIYRLNPTAVAALRDQLDTFWNRALTNYAATVESAGTDS